MSTEHPKALSEAITKLIMGDVFFTARFYSLHVKAEEDPAKVAVAATDGVSLYYNPEAFAKYSLADRTFILCHEILHVVLMHSLRRGGRDPNIWNVACDYAVNGILVEAGKTMVKDGLHDAKYSGLSAEQIYDILIKEGKETPQFMPDVMDYDPKANGGKSAEAQIKDIQMANAKAGATAKAAGSLPDNMARLLQTANVTSLPWYTLLQRFVSRTTAAEYNWARINHRRSQSFNGMLCPQMRSDSLGDVVLGVDCSGSITNKQLAAISQHIKELSISCNPTKVIVLYFTHTVTKTEEFTAPYSSLSLTPGPSGGTDFTPVMEEVNKKYSDATLLIMLTDLYGPCTVTSVIPTIWVTDCPQNHHPFGEKIEGDFND